jgi:hypothetical protein
LSPRRFISLESWRGPSLHISRMHASKHQSSRFLLQKAQILELLVVFSIGRCHAAAAGWAAAGQTLGQDASSRSPAAGDQACSR